MEAPQQWCSTHPVPDPWLRGTLPEAVQRRLVDIPGLEAVMLRVFPPESREEKEMHEIVTDAFPEFRGMTLVSAMHVLASMCLVVRSKCQGKLLQVHEFYCGMAEISKACLAAGVRVKAYDICFGAESMWDHVRGIAFFTPYAGQTP